MTKLRKFRLISVKLCLTTSIQRSILYLYNHRKELLNRFLCTIYLALISIVAGICSEFRCVFMLKI